MAITSSSLSFNSSPLPYLEDREEDFLSILFEEAVEREYFQKLEDYRNNKDGTVQDALCWREFHIETIKRILKLKPTDKFYHRLFLGNSWMVSVCFPLPPKELLSRERITSINLGNNTDLVLIPEEVYEFANLLFLKLNGNKIKEISPSIQNLKKLETLHVQDNALTSLPEELFELRELTDLDISYNQMTVLSSKIRQLIRLTSFEFNGNPCKETPFDGQKCLSIELQKTNSLEQSLTETSAEVKLVAQKLNSTLSRMEEALESAESDVLKATAL